MGYELFDQKATRKGTPTLTITSHGSRISLNADAGDLLRRVDARFVHILWDRDARKIALKPLATADARAFKLNSKVGRRAMMISGATFLRHIGWNISEPITVGVTWDDELGLLEASLPRKSKD